MKHLNTHNINDFRNDNRAVSLDTYCQQVGKATHPAYKSVFIHALDNGKLAVNIEEYDGELARAFKTTRGNIVNRVHKALIKSLESNDDVEVTWYSGFDYHKTFLIQTATKENPKGGVISE